MLPSIKPGLSLAVPHFPTKFQAVIFRLWEHVSAKRLAEVLKTDEETVRQLAFDMGLGEQKWLEEWMTRGYISILRHVWNLLPYSQLCQLLDWSEERLDYVLKEEDFLDVKLVGWTREGRTDCEEVYYRPLTKEEKKATEKIKASMETSILPIDTSEAEAPFSFFADHYAPIVSRQSRDVTIDGSWSIRVLCHGVSDFVEDFSEEVRETYGVTFASESDRFIEIQMNLQTEDEEYHEIQVTDDRISVNAGTPVGVMRALYYLLDLANGAGALSFDKKSYKRKTKVKTRFIYSFCGLYGDVLDKDSRISFPDELLKGYARQGINGVWIQGVFYKIAPYPFAPEKCAGWEERLKNLNEMTRRCARYGIKVYMYINEPRNMPLDFFETCPELKGTRFGGHACFCSSHPETHRYLKETIQMICRQVPLLGGFLNITQSENNVLCYSGGVRTEEGAGEGVLPEDFCPVCGKKMGSVVTSEILTTMADAVAEVNPDIKFFVYAWCWKPHYEEQFEDLVRRLPKNLILLYVSETGIQFKRGGVENVVRDYSLSIVGPGEEAKDLWSMARKYGLEVAAKIQINNSWECSTAPFLPVYDNVTKHMKNLLEQGIEHVMLSWTLGGYISDNIKIASAYFFEDTENHEDPYETVLKNSYGEYAGTVKKAVQHFCRGFSEYPFDMMHIYDGPSNSGVANLLYPEPSGIKPTMTCFPYDDVMDWCADVYTPEILESQYGKVCAEWEKGLAILEKMPTCEFKDMALYGYSLFKGALNQIRYYILRDNAPDKAAMDEIVKSEKELAIMAYEIMLRNSAVGYEAANHYYVTRTSFIEKVINCDYLLSR